MISRTEIESYGHEVAEFNTDHFGQEEAKSPLYDSGNQFRSSTATMQDMLNLKLYKISGDEKEVTVEETTFEEQDN